MDTTAAAKAPIRATPEPNGLVAAPFRWVLRLTITLHALAAFMQAVLAGRFLSGDYDMLRVHFVNAQVVGSLAIAQVLAAVLYWRLGGGPGWPAAVSVGLLAVEPIQIAAGIKRVIGIHIPLGVAIIVILVLLAVWAWRPNYGRCRAATGGRPR